MLLLAVSACSGTSETPLPELPVPKSATYLPAVREQVDAAYKKAAASPRDAEAVGRYGMVLEAYQQYVDARACYERAHALDSRAFRWAYHLALLLEHGNERPVAIATIRKALELRPGDLPARLALASMLLNSGAAEESRAVAESAVRDAPGSARAHYALGRALAALRQHAAAAEQLQQATRLAPGYGGAHYALALVYRDLGRPADGERHMALYQQNRGTDPPADDPLMEEVERLNVGSLVYIRQAEQLYNEGRFPEAAAAYEQALALETDKSIHTALVSTYSRMNAWDKAEAHYRAAIAIDPAFSKAHYNFALLKAERGEYRAAVEAFQKALAADADDPATHTQLARVYELLNEPAAAVRHFRLALTKDPGAHPTRALLINRLLTDGKGREALDEMLVLVVAGNLPSDKAQAALRQSYPRVGTPGQVTSYLRDARRRAEASGRTDVVAAIDIELAAMPSLRR